MGQFQVVGRHFFFSALGEIKWLVFKVFFPTSTFGNIKNSEGGVYRTMNIGWHSRTQTEDMNTEMYV